MTVTAVQYGVGPIGSRIVEAALDRGYELVGAVDVDPAKVGEDLGAVAGLDEELGVTVTDDAGAALAAGPDVVLHSTASSIAAVEEQLVAAMAAGADVVSTTEELSYPWRAHPDAAGRLDDAAAEHGATCLGTGINPGFAMDALPAVATAPCRSVESVRVERVQDAGTRRGPLQRKVGAGLSLEAWEAEVAADAGHVGLPESVAMLAAGLGWELDDVAETMEPVVADGRTETDHVVVEPGEAAGIHQVATGVVAGEPAIELDLRLYVGAPESRDAVSVRGDPDVELAVEGGLHGDVTTPAVVLNSVPRVREAAPGLATMLDLATPRFTA
ncbi:MAG: hypothetical protein U5J98_09705 [Halobacteriales archaeon]|nr:hypothetical protein [Halobacteriales archaeon]